MMPANAGTAAQALGGASCSSCARCWPWAPKGCLKALTAPDQRTKASDSCFFWTAQCSNPAKQLNVDRCGPSFEGLSRSRRRLDLVLRAPRIAVKSKKHMERGNTVGRVTSVPEPRRSAVAVVLVREAKEDPTHRVVELMPARRRWFPCDLTAFCSSGSVL